MSSPRPRVSGVAVTERPPPSAPSEGEAGFAGATWLGRLVDGRYKVESLLGEGGMGAVFLAEHVKLAKKVALKVILPQFAGDGELAERFAREAMASAKLDHPHVASALDYGALPEGGAYLVMPYVRGRSLREAMDSREVSPSGGAGWRFACEIGAQIADALSAAHAHKIVHRDLKPENVILEPREDGSELVKVLDFGVARVVSDDAQAAAAAGKALTRIGTIIGTPGYMAPEQALGESVDTRADLYALGVLLWEIVARESLFPDDDLTAIVTKQLTTEPPRLISIVPDVPVALDELVARLLARARDDRPERAGEVRDVLQRLALGAALERKMLSGEISVPFRTGETPAPMRGGDGTGPQVVGAAPTMHAASADATGARRVAAPSVVVPPSIEKAAERLQGTVDIGPLRNVPISLVVVGAMTPIVLVVAIVGLAFALGGDDATAAPEPAPSAAVAPPAVPPSPAAAERGRPPEPAPSAPSIAMPADSAPIPIELARDVATLLDATDHDERDAAAERIREQAIDGAPAFVAAVVELELARGCRDRRDAVRTLGELADPRALPALERLEDQRRGCGFLGSQDCHRCLRRDLRATLETLRGTGS